MWYLRKKAPVPVYTPTKIVEVLAMSLRLYYSRWKTEEDTAKDITGDTASDITGDTVSYFVCGNFRIQLPFYSFQCDSYILYVEGFDSYHFDGNESEYLYAFGIKPWGDIAQSIKQNKRKELGNELADLFEAKETCKED